MADVETLAIHGGRPAVSVAWQPWPRIDQEAVRAVVDALHPEQLHYAESSVTRRFERRFAHYHGCDFAVATASGSLALVTAYLAAGLGRGEAAEPAEVVVPAFGFHATVAGLRFVGARPVYCDVEPETGNLCPRALAEAISARTRAVVVLHCAGLPAAMDDIEAMCRERGLVLIEDCSHAHGSRYRGRLVGTFGDFAAFSLQASKALSAGEGGVVLCRDAAGFLRACAVANPRRLDGEELALPGDLRGIGAGIKMRMCPLAAGLAERGLDRLDEVIELRRRSHEHLLRAFAIARVTRFWLPPIVEKRTYGAHYELVITMSAELLRHASRSWIVEALRAEGVAVRASDTRALCSLPALRARVFDFLRDVPPPLENARDCPNAALREETSIALRPLTYEPPAAAEQCAEAFYKVEAHLTRGLAARPGVRGAETAP